MKPIPYLLVIFLAGSQVLADRGVLVQKDINLAEPAQRAIVEHNGTWEMLILQTDIKADKATQAIEFMPLPSCPEVSLAPDDCFKNLQTIVSKHNMKYIIGFSRKRTGDSIGKEEGIKIVAEHNLGPHNITVIEIEDVSKFRSWIIDFAKKKSLITPIFTYDLDKVVADYCQRGFRFMAFDVLDVPMGTKTVAPVSYRFKCDHVYYPLKVTNLYGGTGSVEVFYALNPWRDGNADRPKPYDFRNGKHWIFSQEVRLSTEELKTLHPIATNLFCDVGTSFFATKYEGNLQFENDIWLHMGYSSPEFLCMRFLSLFQEQDIESLEFLLATPFALNRQKIYEEPSEALLALKGFIKDHDLSDFQIKSRSSWTGEYRNEFDKPFIEKHLKGQALEDYLFESDKIALHFLVVNRTTKDLNDYRVVSLRIAPLNDYAH